MCMLSLFWFEVILFSLSALSPSPYFCQILRNRAADCNQFINYFFRIPDSIGKDIEKSCQGIYPLHDVLIQKVKVLKKPKFDGELIIVSVMWLVVFIVQSNFGSSQLITEIVFLICFLQMSF